MRYAVFVDAGYFYAQGSQALFGSNLGRVQIQLNPEGVIDQLLETASVVAPDASLLRIYWYDGLLHGAPSADQLQLAEMENLKLRLGVVNVAGQQKGVDTLVVTDLVELARNRAISDALLLSGDADLKIGVEIAQSFGVRVHLIGIEPSHGSQSLALLQEADTATEWPKSAITNLLTRRAVPEEQRWPSSESGAPELSEETVGSLEETISRFVQALSAAEIGTINTRRNPNTIPGEIDRRLLGACGNAMGRLLTPAEKFQMRSMFRAAVRGRASTLPPV